MVIINRRMLGSRQEKNELNLYQLSRSYLGISINNFLRSWFKMSIRDTQAGLKGFIKPKNFSRIKFISKRFFFDLELILLFILDKKKIQINNLILAIPSNGIHSNGYSLIRYILKKKIIFLY
mgnify:CR=1 FL=1